MMDLESTDQLKDRNDGSYITLGLMGKIKGETNDRCHFLPCINVTGSGINAKHVILRHLELKKLQGLRTGPAISDRKGNILHSNNIDELLTELLEELFDEDSSSFPAEIQTRERTQESYHSTELIDGLPILRR